MQRLNIFPQTRVSKPFGLDVINHQINLSFGTCFYKPKTFAYDSFSPFTFEEAYYLDDYKILTLVSKKLGFSIRLYDIDEASFSEELIATLLKKKPLDIGSFLCKSGSFFKELESFNAYIEVFAFSKDSSLFQLLPAIQNQYTEAFLSEYYIVNCLNEKEASERLLELYSSNQVHLMNSYFCSKFDIIENQNLYFFSSSLLS